MYKQSSDSCANPRCASYLACFNDDDKDDDDNDDDYDVNDDSSIECLFIFGWGNVRLFEDS